MLSLGDGTQHELPVEYNFLRTTPGMPPYVPPDEATAALYVKLKLAHEYWTVETSATEENWAVCQIGEFR